MLRILNPATNPNGWIAAAGAVYAAAVMIYNATHHYGVFDINVLIAAAGAVLALFSRQLVTPVRDPRDGNGQPLLTVAAAQQILPTVTGSVTQITPPGKTG